MDLERLRKLAITALSLDDFLYERLVLKGGNALRLVHQISSRTSLDLDYSIDGDFDDLEELRKRVVAALENRFTEEGLVVFDTDLSVQPALNGGDSDPTWGGYRITFKCVPKAVFEAYRGELSRIRLRSLDVSPRHDKKFKIDISKYEYVGERVVVELDQYTFYAYSREMIAAEKLRAICQQMPDYPRVAHPRARARDFYDIWSISESGADLTSPAFFSLVRKVFVQKTVPISWLQDLQGVREFHRQEWPAVRDAISGSVQPFDFYYDFVIALVERLKPSRVE